VSATQAFPLVLTCLLAAAGVPALGAQEAPAGEAADLAPLFASHDLLELTLEADLDRLEDDRQQDSEERPGALLVPGADGQPVKLDLQVRTRGNFRLQRRTCAMPNLRLNFKKQQAEGTVFEGQDKLKLVGYCRDRDNFEQNALEEYLVYRTYNLLTDVSFRVRLARITYQDVNGKKKPVTRYGFLIEDDDALAARLGGQMIEVAAAPAMAMEGEAQVRTALFQYMVGNTDWSMVQFHNFTLVRLEDGKHVAVPYDFDWSGLVDASYAVPDPSLGTRDVKERVYRGFCRPEVDMEAVYAFFNEKREAIYELYRNQPGLEEGNVRRALRYLDDFYDTINSNRRGRAIENNCRKA